VYAKALVISHVYGDSDKIRALVREKMEDEYGRVYQIKANCPTRFSIQHLICADVLKCEQALMYAVASSRWVEACKTSTKGKEFEEIVRRPLSSQIGEGCNFWEDLRLAIEVGQPIADAIHQLEADEPLLSQLLPVWSGIASSADKFVTEHPEEKFANLSELVSDRATKHAPVTGDFKVNGQTRCDVFCVRSGPDAREEATRRPLFPRHHVARTKPTRRCRKVSRALRSVHGERRVEGGA